MPSSIIESKHVTIGYSHHFLVINGTRGPLVYGHNKPATHPDGYLVFRRDADEIPPEFRGKILCAVELPDTVEELPANSPTEIEERARVEHAQRERMAQIMAPYELARGQVSDPE